MYQMFEVATINFDTLFSSLRGMARHFDKLIVTNVFGKVINNGFQFTDDFSYMNHNLFYCTG